MLGKLEAYFQKLLPRPVLPLVLRAAMFVLKTQF